MGSLPIGLSFGFIRDLGKSVMGEQTLPESYLEVKGQVTIERLFPCSLLQYEEHTLQI